MALRSKREHVDKGVSLARGPALVLGSVLLTFGLLAFLADGSSPTDGFPDGTITDGESFAGFEVNDWTAMITAAGGGLLLFGAAQHLLAKTMSLLVGLALGAASVIALVDGDDVLGLAAANGLTALAWGAAAALLLINALLPRKGGGSHERDVGHDPAVAPRRETVAHREERVAAPVARDADDPRRDVAHDADDPRRDVVRDGADPRRDVAADEHATRVDEAPATRSAPLGRDHSSDERVTGDGAVRDASAGDPQVRR